MAVPQPGRCKREWQSRGLAHAHCGLANEGRFAGRSRGRTKAGRYVPLSSSSLVNFAV